jgi:hypothetical protein
VKVAIPVAVEKSPIKDEYSFGLGNCKMNRESITELKRLKESNCMKRRKTEGEKNYLRLEL